MSAWDPVGTNGSSDVYTSAIINPVSDPATFGAPNSAYIYGKWHSGAPIEFADIAYAIAFGPEWATRDGADDKFFDSSFSTSVAPGLKTNKGYMFNADGSVTSFYDYNWPMDLGQVAATGVVSPKAGNPGRQTVVSWDVYEACAPIIAEGAASGKIYSFIPTDGTTNVDVIAAESVADLKAKLEDMKARQYVPTSIKQWVTPRQAVARYDATLKFLATYGHLYISNGPFMISKADNRTNSVELTAFRDYPYQSDYCPIRFATKSTRIDDVTPSTSITAGSELSFFINASTNLFPFDLFEPLSSDAQITVTIHNTDRSEIKAAAAWQAPGELKVTFLPGALYWLYRSNNCSAVSGRCIFLENKLTFRFYSGRSKTVLFCWYQLFMESCISLNNSAIAPESRFTLIRKLFYCTARAKREL